MDDLFDFDLDTALADDPTMQQAVSDANLRDLMMAFFRHLVAHHWAGKVIGMCAPRGPVYMHLSERMCLLHEQEGAEDPLGAVCRLSNLVIGSALTTSMTPNEKHAPIDAEQASTYARLHRDHHISPEIILADGINCLLTCTKPPCPACGA